MTLSLIILFTLFGWSFTDGDWEQQIQLQVADGNPVWARTTILQQLRGKKYDMVLSPDSATVLYGELGKNGASILTDLDIDDPANFEAIYAVDKIKAYLPKYNSYHRFRWLIYILAISPFALLIMVILLCKNIPKEDVVYSSTIRIKARNRIFEHIVDNIVIIITFNQLILSNIGKNLRSVDLMSFATNIPLYHIIVWLLLVVVFAYYFIGEYYFGKTIGKWIFGYRVVTEDGHRPSARAIAIRAICHIVRLDSATAFLLLLKDAKDGSPQLAQDLLSKTRVISDRVAKENSASEEADYGNEKQPE